MSVVPRGWGGAEEGFRGKGGGGGVSEHARLAQLVVGPRLALEAHVHIWMPCRFLSRGDHLARASEDDAHLGLAIARLRRVGHRAREHKESAEAFAVVGWAADNPDALRADILVRLLAAASDVAADLVSGESVLGQPAAPPGVQLGGVATEEAAAEAGVPSLDLRQPHRNWLRLVVGLAAQRDAEAMGEVSQPAPRRLEAARRVVAAVFAHELLHGDAQPLAGHRQPALVVDGATAARAV